MRYRKRRQGQELEYRLRDPTEHLQCGLRIPHTGEVKGKGKEYRARS